MKNLILFSAILAIFSSCEKEIILELPPYNSKIVINGEFNSDTTMKLQISRSFDILKPIDSTGYLIKTAIVKIYENNTYIGDATYTGQYYTFNKKPIAGNNYSVEVTATGYPKAIAKLTMPKPINITANYIDSVGLDNDGFKVGQITFSFPDNPTVNNYYKLFVQWYNAPVFSWNTMQIESDDVIFLNNDKLKDGSYLFSDRTFQGKTKSITIKTTSIMGRGTPKFQISLKNFNEDYFNYLIQTDNYSQSGNGVSAEAVILKSNVTNGLGMVGGVSAKLHTIF